MPASSTHPMSLPRTSAFSDFSNPDSRFDPVVVPSRARDYYRDTDYQNQQGLSSPVLDYGNMTSTSASTSSASHNLPGTPDRDKLLVLDTEQASPHVRTNFRRGYHPPAIKDNPVRQPPPIERQENNAIHKPRTSNTSDRSDEVPFDMKNDTTKPPSQQEQQQGQSRHHPPNTTWAAREELDPERGRFVITPPKYSNPTRLNTLHHPKAMYGVRRDDDSDDKAVVALGMGAAAASTVTPGPVEDYYSSPHRIIEPNPSPCDDYEEFGLSPGSMGSKGDLDNPEEEDSLFDFELEASSHPRGFPKIASNRKSTHVQHRRAKNKMIEIDDRDDDTASLEEAPYGHKTPSPTNLHDRTAQAWAVRNKVSSLKTNKSKEDAWQKIQGKSKSKQEPKTTSPSDEEKLNKQGVSFGVTDTVHHFQPHIVPDDDDGTLGTFNSFDDRSLNSEYTKTMESEVEDVIKDIFFIGTEYKSRPGRRKLKYRHEVKRKLQLRKMNILEEDEGSAGTDDKTKDTENDDVAGASKYLVNIPNDHKATPSIPKSSQKKTASNVKPRSSLEEAPTPNSPDRSTPPKSEKRTVTEKQVSKAHREEKEADDDPFLAMWGYVEGGMKAMSEALGLEPDPAETTERKASSSSSKKSSSSSKEKAAKSSDTRPQSCDKRRCGEQITLIVSGDEACTYSPTKTTRKKAEPMEEADQGLGFIDYAQDTMFGPLPSVETGDSGSFDVGGSKSQSQSQCQSVSIDDDDTADDDIDDAEQDPKRLSASDLDERDPRLGYLALNAARSKHQIRGVKFDESIQIDLLSEVKVSILELKLPLGLVFLENDGGCFVTKVVPDGSAARSGGAEIGDQLAAINGTNSIQMDVDGIIAAISKAPDKKCVELMFVRYQGPFRPVAAMSLVAGSFESSSDGTLEKDSRLPNLGRDSIVRVIQPDRKEKEKKGLGRWFGRRKKK